MPVGIAWPGLMLETSGLPPDHRPPTYLPTHLPKYGCDPPIYGVQPTWTTGTHVVGSWTEGVCLEVCVPVSLEWYPTRFYKLCLASERRKPHLQKLVPRKWGYVHGYVAIILRRNRRKYLSLGAERDF